MDSVRGSLRKGGRHILRTSGIPCVVCVVLTMTPLPARAAPQDVAADPQALAMDIAAELARPLYGISRVEWRQRASGADWRERRGPAQYPPASSGPMHPGLWCSEATDRVGAGRREAVFYGLRPEDPLDCRLEQLRYVIASERADDVYRAMRGALQARFGDGRESLSVSLLSELGADDINDGATAYPSHLWQDARLWFAPTGFIVLFRIENRVSVLARSSVLTRALRPLPDPTRPYGIDILTWQVVNALRASDPEAVEIILSREGLPDQAGVRRAALRILKRRVAVRRGNEHAMLTLAASLVLGRLSVAAYDIESPEMTREVEPFQRFGISFDYACCSIVVANDFFGEVARLYAGTVWGELASAEMFLGGADACEGGFQYREVIREGPRWLKRFPRSQYAVPVMAAIAQAYETWWSASRAPDGDEFATASEHAAGAATARLEAIRWYERVVREAPTSVEAMEARRVLVLLKLGVDTGQRRFHAVYA
jgi:hypothetical protein